MVTSRAFAGGIMMKIRLVTLMLLMVILALLSEIIIDAWKERQEMARLEESRERASRRMMSRIVPLNPTSAVRGAPPDWNSDTSPVPPAKP